MNNNTSITGKQDVIPKERLVLSPEEKRERNRAYRRKYELKNREKIAEYRQKHKEERRFIRS